MKITNLRPLSTGGRDTAPAGDASIRGTDAQDLAVAAKPDRSAPEDDRPSRAGGAARDPRLRPADPRLELDRIHVSRERLRIATVDRRAFHPRRLRAGHGGRRREPDAVRGRARQHQLRRSARATPSQAGQVLATLVSPSLESEYQRERATLESLDTALQRQAHRDPPPEARHQGSRGPRERADPRRRPRAAARAVRLGQGRDRRSATCAAPRTTASPRSSPTTTPWRPSGLEQESLDLDLRARAPGARARRATWSRTSSAAWTS